MNNDKIEVGEYVRTNEGILGKLLRIERDDIDTSLKWYVLYAPKYSLFAEGEVYIKVYINKPYIIKHSKNIIELIEVGDIVEILLNEVNGYTNKVEIVNEEQIEILKTANKKYIKSILTKEEFESRKYNVEED